MSKNRSSHKYEIKVKKAMNNIFQGCDPVTTKYKAKLSRQENGELEITCSNSLNKKGSNNGDCKRSLCECDKAFAENFANNFEEWDASNWKLEEKGEYDDKCKKVVIF